MLLVTIISKTNELLLAVAMSARVSCSFILGERLLRHPCGVFQRQAYSSERARPLLSLSAR